MIKTSVMSWISVALFLLIGIHSEMLDVDGLYKPCSYSCSHGSCLYDNCVSSECPGGGCTFLNSKYSTCTGGACTFDNSIGSSCRGGR